MRRSANFPTACLATCLLWSASALAEDAREDAIAWLKRMAVASERLNYEATFVYNKGLDLQSLQVVHRYDEQGVRERLTSLTGPPRELLRTGSRVTCYLPDDKLVLVAEGESWREGRNTLFRPGAKIGEHYRLSSRKGARVAGRATREVVVEPLDVYRYGHRLSIDVESALPLKSELIGPNGQPLEQIVYTNVELRGHIPDSRLVATTQADGYKWYRAPDTATAAPAVSMKGWRATWLPPGFVTVNEALARGTVASRQHLAYSDGVASLSVFVEELQPGAKGLRGLSQLGPTNAYGVMHGLTQVTVVGEVPVRTVRRVAESLVRSP